MNKKIRLSDSEWVVMQKLWDDPPRTMMQLTRDLADKKGWAKTTVMTLLNRMQAKGAVRWEEGGRARLYYPAVTQEDLAAQEARGFIDRVYRGSVGNMVNSLIEDRSLSKDDIDELYDILRRAEEKR